MTTEPNSFLTVSSKEAALLYQTAANLQLQFLFRFYSYALQKSASCETKLGAFCQNSDIRILTKRK